MSVVLFALGLIYFLQSFSPLRLNTDSYRLLSLAVSASEGTGYLVDGQPDQFPHGYPLLVKTLISAGIANSGSLVVLNLLFYTLGLLTLYIWSKGLFDRTFAMVVVLWVASSWVLIKHLTIPLSDSGYFGFSLVSLYCLWKFYKSPIKDSWPYLCGALGFIYLSLQFRTVGISLLPTAVVTAVLHPDLDPFLKSLRRHREKKILGLILIGGVCCIGFLGIYKTEWFDSQFLAKGSYFQSMSEYFKEKTGASGLILNLIFRNLEIGEIFLNLPANKVSALLPVFNLAGIVGWSLVAFGGIWLYWRGFLPIAIYLFLYCGIMIFWPAYDTRFWVPLLPVFALAVGGPLREMAVKSKKIFLNAVILLACHVLMGFVALAYSTKISFSGKYVSEKLGDEGTRMTYREALKNGFPVEEGLVHHGKVRIIRIFEPMATSNDLKEKSE